MKRKNFLNQFPITDPAWPMFFMMSGYFVSTSLQSSKTIKNYILNRVFRIYPGLFVLIIITIIAFSLTGANFLHPEVIVWIPTQVVGFIYTPHFLDSYGFGSYNGSLWTLTIELQFYILLPLTYYLFARKQNTDNWFYGLFVVFALLAIISGLLPQSKLAEKLIRYSFVPHFHLFLLGVIFQRKRIFKLSYIYNKAHYWIAGYLIYCFTFHHMLPVVMFHFIGNILLCFTTLSVAYTLPGITKNILRGNDISYGIYLYHGLVMALIVQLQLQQHFNLVMIIVVAYVLAYISWISVERPFINLKKQTIKADTKVYTIATDENQPAVG